MKPVMMGMTSLKRAPMVNLVAACVGLRAHLFQVWLIIAVTPSLTAQWGRRAMLVVRASPVTVIAQLRCVVMVC